MDRRRLADLYATPDPNDNAERMLTHIVRGVPKERTDTIKTRADSDLWDLMARDVAAALARGATIDYGSGRAAWEGWED